MLVPLAATPVVATVAGVVLAEEHSLASFAAGHEVTAIWFAYVGAIALYAGVYVLDYRTLLPRIARRVSAQ